MTEYQPPTIDDVESLREHKLNPKELVVSAISCIPVIGSMAAEIASNALGTGQNSCQSKLVKLQINWLVEQIPEISKKLDELIHKLPKEEVPESSDIGAVLEAAFEVSRKTTEFKKRELLKRAVVNAFDENIYREGIVLRLMEILENLHYGEVELLRQLEDKTESTQVKLLDRNDDSIIYYHLEILAKHEFVLIWNRESNVPLGISNLQAHTKISELGRKLLAFVTE